MQITYMDTACKTDKIVAEFGIYLPNMRITLNRLRLMKGKEEGTYWVPAPSFKNKEDAWQAYWQFDEDVAKAFGKKVSEAAVAFLRELEAKTPPKQAAAQQEFDDGLPF